MKTLIFTDIHGKSLAPLEEIVLDEKVESIICLGDFDTNETVHEYLSFRKKWLSEGKTVSSVCGNHDVWNYFKLPMNIHSLPLSSMELQEQIHADAEVLDFYREILPKTQHQFSFGKRNAIALHGAFFGKNIVFYHPLPDKLRKIVPDSTMWQYLFDYSWVAGDNAPLKYIVEENFQEMKQKGVSIIFRGHDHASLAIADSPYEALYDEYQEVLLHAKRDYIINIGAWVHGKYALYDEEKQRVYFRYI